MKLGQKLKEARLNAGLKQEELAKQLGVSRQTISSWENDRSYPDLGSAVKLSNLYGRSMDEMLRHDDSVIQAFEDLAAKRRAFWQRMLEISIILQLGGQLLAGQDFSTAAIVLFLPGLFLCYLSIAMHLRVFHHDWVEVTLGILGLSSHILCNILRLAGILTNGLLTSCLSLVSLLLIWGAGVWTIDWKSTRLWLIIALYIGIPFLTIGTYLQDSGNLNTANPFFEIYQVEEVLYPQGEPVPEYTKIDLSGRLAYVEDRDGERTKLGKFVYIDPVEGQTQKGIWQLIPEENPDAMYKLTVEADDSVILSYYREEQLLWKGLLTDYGRDTCSVSVSTFGKTSFHMPTWYAPGSPDPVPYLKEIDIIQDATVTIVVAGLETDTLTLYEEYHHGTSTETAVYTLSPNKPYSYKFDVSARYDGKEEWALYRIPYEDGEYRFILTFGK